MKVFANDKIKDNALKLQKAARYIDSALDIFDALDEEDAEIAQKLDYTFIEEIADFMYSIVYEILPEYLSEEEIEK